MLVAAPSHQEFCPIFLPAHPTSAWPFMILCTTLAGSDATTNRLSRIFVLSLKFCAGFVQVQGLLGWAFFFIALSFVQAWLVVGGRTNDDHGNNSSRSRGSNIQHENLQFALSRLPCFPFFSSLFPILFMILEGSIAGAHTSRVLFFFYLSVQPCATGMSQLVAF